MLTTTTFQPSFRPFNQPNIIQLQTVLVGKNEGTPELSGRGTKGSRDGGFREGDEASSSE